MKKSRIFKILLFFRKVKTVQSLRHKSHMEAGVLSIGTLSAGWISWLPILAAALFTWFMDTRSDVQLKIVILCTQVMWLIYDLYFRNYVASAFDVMTMCSNLIGLFMILKKKA